MFIVFEGPDGAGSSTQVKQLYERLKKAGYEVTQTKEPTKDTRTGRLIRDALQHQWNPSPEALQLLFCADRKEHLKNTIEPALANGRVAISDRYFFSTIAYGSLDIDDLGWLKSLNKFFRVPDITVYLKLDPETCLERIRGRGEAIERFEEPEKLRKIAEAYEKLAADYPGFVTVDASRSIEAVAEEVWEAVSEKLPR